MIKNWIAEYNPQNEDEVLSAMREIMQEIVLQDFLEQTFSIKRHFMVELLCANSINVAKLI